jgi:hypothetical protein
MPSLVLLGSGRVDVKILRHTPNPRLPKAGARSQPSSLVDLPCTRVAVSGTRACARRCWRRAGTDERRCDRGEKKSYGGRPPAPVQEDGGCGGPAQAARGGVAGPAPQPARGKRAEAASAGDDAEPRRRRLVQPGYDRRARAGVLDRRPGPGTCVCCSGRDVARTPANRACAHTHSKTSCCPPWCRASCRTTPSSSAR